MNEDLQNESVQAQNGERYQEELATESSEEKATGFYSYQGAAPIFLTLLWSLLLSALSVVNPFLSSFATNLQSQNLYAGWAMAQGQVAYANIYGTSGLLFYLAAWAGNLALGSILLAAFQALALLFSGLQVYQLTYRLSGQASFSSQLVNLFYLFVLVLGFGGLYAGIFVLPFLFWSLNHLVRYLAGEIKDERFILYGAVAAVAFMVEPFSTIIFYGTAFIVFFFYNIAKKRWARGFYQLLGTLLGYSLVFYPLGYWTVFNGIFGLAISQVLYPLESLGLHHYLLQNGLFYGALFVALGFLFAIVANLFSSSKAGTASLRALGILGVLLVFLVAVFQADQGSYQLLPAVPFVILLFALWFMKEQQRGSHARHSRLKRKHPSSVWQQYFKGTYFLSVLAGLYLLGMPLVEPLILSRQVSAERTEVANYIQEHADAKDTVYAWDTNASLYQASNHLSAASILSPTLYQQTAENQLGLVNQLQNKPPHYILVNSKVPLTDQMKRLLESNYKKNSLELKHFTLYRYK